MQIKLDTGVEKFIQTNPKVETDDKRLREVCEEFEAVFVNMMLKSSRATVGDGGLVEKSNGTKMFEEMRDEELSKAISKSEGGGLGVAKMLYEQMKTNLKRPRVEERENE